MWSRIAQRCFTSPPFVSSPSLYSTSSRHHAAEDLLLGVLISTLQTMLEFENNEFDFQNCASSFPTSIGFKNCSISARLSPVNIWRIRNCDAKVYSSYYVVSLSTGASRSISLGALRQTLHCGSLCSVEVWPDLCQCILQCRSMLSRLECRLVHCSRKRHHSPIDRASFGRAFKHPCTVALQTAC